MIKRLTREDLLQGGKLLIGEDISPFKKPSGVISDKGITYMYELFSYDGICHWFLAPMYDRVSGWKIFKDDHFPIYPEQKAKEIVNQLY